jgi:hypothetical protein
MKFAHPRSSIASVEAIAVPITILSQIVANLCTDADGRS